MVRLNSLFTLFCSAKNGLPVLPYEAHLPFSANQKAVCPQSILEVRGFLRPNFCLTGQPWS